MFSQPPKSICIMRLSALGDVCHALPVVRTLQSKFTDAKFTWIISRLEHQLIGDIPDIEFIVFDKSQGLGAYKQLRKDLHDKHFDLLLHMQTSARANVAAFFVPATIKLGYDRLRSREGHGLVINRRIGRGKPQHQIDDMFGFAEALGIKERQLRWDIPIPEEAHAWAAKRLNADKPLLVVNPCSSPSQRVHRNWYAEAYAKVVEYAERELGMRVALVGGPTPLERKMADDIIRFTLANPINLQGKTNLKQLLAVLSRAEIVLTSDSGPAHMATAVGARVIGLHAATNPHQTGPYLDQDIAVNAYPEAIQKEYGKPFNELPWGTRAHGENVMRLITPQQVIERLRQVFERLWIAES